MCTLTLIYQGSTEPAKNFASEIRDNTLTGFGRYAQEIMICHYYGMDNVGSIAEMIRKVRWSARSNVRSCLAACEPEIYSPGVGHFDRGRFLPAQGAVHPCFR